MENSSNELSHGSIRGVRNGFVMGTDSSSYAHVSMVTTKILLASESTDEASCLTLDPKTRRAAGELSDLEISATERTSDARSETSQAEESVINCLPPGFLKLAVSTDRLTPPTCQIPETFGCLSPLTPTSKFHKSVLSNGPSSLIIATVLCNWDNIFGPKVRCLWIAEHKRRTDLTLDLLNFIANQTLSGEIMHDLNTPVLELKLYISTDRRIILATLVFGAESKKEVAVHSLSVIVPYGELQRFLLWKDVCLEWMQRAAQRLRIELTKSVDRAFESFHKSFAAFISNAESSILAGFPKRIELLNTVLHPHHVFDAEFVRRAIVAHLFQCQQTVVIGDSALQINLMICTLSLFTMSHRKHRSRVMMEETNGLCYSPEFCLQGLFITEDSIDCLLKNVYFSRHPTALVDLSKEKVSYLCLPNEFFRQRRKSVLQDLNSLYADDPNERTRTLESIYEQLSFKEALVSDFLKEFHFLPLTHGVREISVRSFMSFLQRKALVLIQLTEIEMQKNSSVDVFTFLPKLRQTLSLKFFCDLMIVLCVAELLKPGIMGSICGSEPNLDRLMP